MREEKVGESSSAGERSWSRVGRRRGSVSPFSQARPARQRPAGRGKRPLIGCHRPGRRETVCLLYCIWSLRVKMGSVVVLLCAGIKRSAYRDRQQRFQTQSHDRHTGHNAPYLVHVCSARFETWWQCPPEMLCGLLEYGTRTPTMASAP